MVPVAHSLAMRLHVEAERGGCSAGPMEALRACLVCVPRSLAFQVWDVAARVLVAAASWCGATHAAAARLQQQQLVLCMISDAPEWWALQVQAKQQPQSSPLLECGCGQAAVAAKSLAVV